MEDKHADFKRTIEEYIAQQQNTLPERDDSSYIADKKNWLKIQLKFEMENELRNWLARYREKQQLTLREYHELHLFIHDTMMKFMYVTG